MSEKTIEVRDNTLVVFVIDDMHSYKVRLVTRHGDGARFLAIGNESLQDMAAYPRPGALHIWLQDPGP